ncbi:MAG: hypothetical protein Q4D02_04075 [Clostridia bacterium]|nr:hypothetical protein [Clostridia bacterium]
MKELRQFYFGDLNSVSVAPEEVTVIQLKAGESIEVHRELYTAPIDQTLVVDRLRIRKGKASCTMIRQIIDGFQVQQFPVRPDRFLRRVASNKGFKTIIVPGGITPLTRYGYVPVPDFNMNGTTYFLFPYSFFKKLTAPKEA